jgi:hypothetical protein
MWEAEERRMLITTTMTARSMMVCDDKREPTKEERERDEPNQLEPFALFGRDTSGRGVRVKSKTRTWTGIEVDRSMND